MGPMGLIGHMGLIELIGLSYKRNNNKEMFLLSFCCYCVFILIIIYRI